MSIESEELDCLSVLEQSYTKLLSTKFNVKERSHTLSANSA